MSVLSCSRCHWAGGSAPYAKPQSADAEPHRAVAEAEAEAEPEPEPEAEPEPEPVMSEQFPPLASFPQQPLPN